MWKAQDTIIGRHESLWVLAAVGSWCDCWLPMLSSCEVYPQTHYSRKWCLSANPKFTLMLGAVVLLCFLSHHHKMNTHFNATSFEFTSELQNRWASYWSITVYLFLFSLSDMNLDIPSRSSTRSNGNATARPRYSHFQVPGLIWNMLHPSEVPETFSV